jgi:hypothetical protein
MTDDNLLVRPIFINSVFQQLQVLVSPKLIDWGYNNQSVQYSAESMYNDIYRKDVELVRRYFMEDGQGRIDRHKIIALTQKTILSLQPLVFINKTEYSEYSENEGYALNAEFAFLFGIQFISRWNELYYPKQHFQNPNNRFDTEKFLFPLNETCEGQSFWREHRKWLMAKKTNPFPLFLAAQLWFLIEQWGLTYMRGQKGHPLENRTDRIPINK